MLDPGTIRLTRHVVDRYIERRGWAIPADDAEASAIRADADWTIRTLLERVARQNPSLWQKPGSPAVRRYVHGNLAWITDANSTTVITFYAHDPKHAHRNASRKARARRERNHA